MRNIPMNSTAFVTSLEGQTFCRRFHEVAKRYPDNIAVCCERISYTYLELEERSALLACRLIENGVKREDIVGLATGRSADTIVAMLGVWKAGAAYFYRNSDFPKSLTDDVIELCRCPVVINDEYLRQIDWSAKAPTDFDLSAPESLALLIFTSGSTAKPKGVMIEHRSIMAMSHSVSDFALTEKDAVCVFPSFSFVASVSDIFPALLSGSAIYIIGEELRRDIKLILNYFIEHGITMSFLPPHMAEKLQQLENGQTKLRLLVVGSENMRNITSQHYEIRHVFGSSEMCSLIADYVVSDARTKYPVGSVKPGIKYYIVDGVGVQVPTGCEGELWLSGPQLSRGYFFDQQKTAAQYQINPFCSERGYERVLKTGDIVCELESGELMHISRADNMFKIRGYRVEAGAVEAVIVSYPGIKGAVVQVFPDSRGHNVLCGFFLADGEADPDAIKAFMKERLPHYMVPSYLVQIDEFPRNFNNKVNRMDFKPPTEIDDQRLLEKLN